MIVRRGLRVALMLVACVALLAGGVSVAVAVQDAGPTAHVAKKKAKRKRATRPVPGPTGPAGPPGPNGPAGAQGPGGPPGAGTPIRFLTAASTPATVLYARDGLSIEASCSDTKTTSLTARSLADDGIIRATDVVNGTIAAQDDFDANALMDLTPGGAASNYTLTYLSAAGHVITADYTIANLGGTGAGTNAVADCVAFGTVDG